MQAAHALREFSHNYPNQDKSWYEGNNSIIILTCKTYKDYKKLLAKAQKEGLLYVSFREPDIAYQETASAFVPHPDVKHFLRHCQLLGGASQVSETPTSLLDYVHLMRHTPQGNQTVWAHGKAVVAKLHEILSGQYLNWPRIDTLAWKPTLPLDCTVEDVETYCLFHDIGKTVTHDGQGHFPGHAKASSDLWLKLDGRERIARWMLNDMAIHTMKKEEFLLVPDKEIHRLVGLAEVYANAEMFGGFDSDSFKIKLRKVSRNGNF